MSRRKDVFAMYQIVDNGCWQWTGRIDRHGYGRLSGRLAHRVAYEAVVGQIPAGMQLDHLCRNRCCINPRHLEPVTNAENSRRGASVITHCPQGHPYDQANTYLDRFGHRHCRACNRAIQAARKRSRMERGALQ